jgi:peptide/nickel transport system substrate-binding protein
MLLLVASGNKDPHADRKENAAMTRLSRRQILAGIAGTAAVSARGAPAVHAQKRGGTLRFAAQADLRTVDPVWTTAYITRNHGYLVYDTLFGADENSRIKPQMIDQYTTSADGMKYTFTLRDRLRWHDGHPVQSEDCVESLRRWGKKDRFGQLLMAHTRKIVSVDRKTFALELAERFGPVLEALGKTSGNVPFMMPARIAATSPDQQIKEIVGSGPFKFVEGEWQPGNQAVYVRNPDYVPRNETPSGSTGGKAAYLERVVWRYIPDFDTAADALSAGEIDWWEYPPLDYIPKIEQNPALQTLLLDPLGTQGWLRPNHLHAPFNNKKARQALAHMMDQVTYLHLAIEQPAYYRPCYSVFACGGPYATKAGAEAIMQHDLHRARQLVKESGYDGRPVVVLDATDYPFLHRAALVTRRRLESIGFNVELKGMPWSKTLVVRASKEPPDKGGWNILHSFFTAVDVIDPSVHFALSGAGSAAWFGWPDIPQLEKLITDWVRATDQTKRKQIAEAIQKVALAEVPYVPWGEWFLPTACRKNVQGILKFTAPLFWNIVVK